MINESQFNVLKYLKDINVETMKKDSYGVSGTLGISYSGASQHLGILESIGLIKKVKNQKKNFFVITEKGIEEVINYAINRNKEEENNE